MRFRKKEKKTERKKSINTYIHTYIHAAHCCCCCCCCVRADVRWALRRARGRGRGARCTAAQSRKCRGRRVSPVGRGAPASAGEHAPECTPDRGARGVPRTLPRDDRAQLGAGDPGQGLAVRRGDTDASAQLAEAALGRAGALSAPSWQDVHHRPVRSDIRGVLRDHEDRRAGPQAAGDLRAAELRGHRDGLREVVPRSDGHR